jgi:HTH-type transcriptional regulator/antitoxin HigA
VYPDVATPPGEHLADTLAEMKISQAELARRMGRPQPAINQIVRGLKAITAETALQLEDALGVSAETWLNLQTNYELTKARLALKAAKKRAKASTVARR